MVKVLSATYLPIFFALLLCSANVAFSAKKIDAAKEDLSDIKQKIHTLKKELDSSQEAHHDVVDALKESETAISLANQKLREITKKQNQNQNTLTKLKEQSLSLNEDLARQQKQLSTLMYQQYAQGDQSYTQLILQNKNPNQIARDIQYQSYIAKAHAKLINDMQLNLSQVKKLNRQTTVALQKVVDLKTKQESERKTLEQQKREKAKVLKTLAKQIAAQRNQIKKLTRDEKNLSNLVERLARIVPKLAKKKTTSQQNASKKAAGATVKNEATPDNSYAGVNFSSLKGKLKLPVRGELTNRFGSTRADSGVSWKGLFIRANEGADVKSVASGQVVFADWMRGFGNLIIVDH
ncbi:MAG: murein hydrolase activator EnvC family protein, partial [Methylophilaceae bacterium]